MNTFNQWQTEDFVSNDFIPSCVSQNRFLQKTKQNETKQNKAITTRHTVFKF